MDDYTNGLRNLPDSLAEEIFNEVVEPLIETWINGNRKDVISELCDHQSRDHARTALISAAFVTFLVKYDQMQAEVFFRMLERRW